MSKNDKFYKLIVAMYYYNSKRSSEETLEYMLTVQQNIVSGNVLDDQKEAINAALIAPSNIDIKRWPDFIHGAIIAVEWDTEKNAEVHKGTFDDAIKESKTVLRAGLIEMNKPFEGAKL